MIYENQVIVLPMGAKLTGQIHFNDCVLYVQNRRKTLKIGNALRVNRLNDGDIVRDCKIVSEGTMFNVQKIIPFNIYKAVIYLDNPPTELIF